MLSTFEVKGAYIEVSVSDKSIPASDYFNAPASFPPSPIIPTVRLDLIHITINGIWITIIKVELKWFFNLASFSQK